MRTLTPTAPDRRACSGAWTQYADMPVTHPKDGLIFAPQREVDGTRVRVRACAGI